MLHNEKFLRSILLAVALVMAASSVGNAAAPEETKIYELAPGVYFRKCQTEPEFLGCNQGWIIFKDFVLVIDANFPGQAKEVIRIIRSQTDKPIKYIFDTHHHGDHADGNVIYKEIGAVPIASERTKPLFQTLGLEGFETSKKEKPDEYGGLDYKLPEIYFPRKMVFDDGEMRVELLHFGHAHTGGDAVAWLPKHGILFTGDCIVNGAFNFTGNSDTASWINVINHIRKLPVKTLAPGHGELGDKSTIKTQQRYFIELRKEIAGLISKDRTLEEIKKEVKLPWYKRWTGVDVLEREENIEHVYSELSK
ncbi:MAG: hypothetical protein CMJ76_08010 [Planctomycetaceae bacterium]|nr:hypothetical protein [Planctomycetaceae bacterium]|tara:strand:- start:47 stop:970 length:924 start_codon:yes stop_codon:yes gene_type:complete